MDTGGGVTYDDTVEISGRILSVPNNFPCNSGVASGMILSTVHLNVDLGVCQRCIFISIEYFSDLKALGVH